MNFRINLKIVSFLFALILWFYVNIFLSPETHRTIEVPLVFKNIPSTMRMSCQAKKVELVLSGSRREFIFSGEDTIQASIDLYSLRPGPVFFPVKVVTPAGLAVTALEPAQVEVIGEVFVSRIMPLEIIVKGRPAEGLLAAPAIASPTSVILEGPKELIDRVQKCLVSVSILEIQNSISESKNVELVTAGGAPLHQIKVIPEKVDITIPLIKGYPTKNLMIVPQFINKAQDGLKLASYSVDPQEVEISGPRRFLDQISNLHTGQIDLSLLTASSTLISLIERPPFENVTLVGSNTVTVKITFSPTQLLRTLVGLPITLKKTNAQFCSVFPSSYTMILRGFSEDLRQVIPSNLHLDIDTQDMKPGTNTVPLPLPQGLPPSVEVVEFIPPKAIIQVSPVITEPASQPSSGL